MKLRFKFLIGLLGAIMVWNAGCAVCEGSPDKQYSLGTNGTFTVTFDRQGRPRELQLFKPDQSPKLKALLAYKERDLSRFTVFNPQNQKIWQGVFTAEGESEGGTKIHSNISWESSEGGLQDTVSWFCGGELLYRLKKSWPEDRSTVTYEATGPAGIILFTNTYNDPKLPKSIGGKSPGEPIIANPTRLKTNDVVNDPIAFWELFRTNRPAAQALLDKQQQDMDAALASATNSIPYAAEFARLFPGAFASFSYYTGVVGATTFNMEALLFDRYTLLMKVPVTFEEGRRKVKGFGDPEFLMREISSVKKIRKVGVGPDGKPVASENLAVGLNGDAQRRFGADEWKKVVEAKGDFSVIEFPLTTNSPAPGFEDYRKDWELQRKPLPRP
jgi:hypothetical protein